MAGSALGFRRTLRRSEVVGLSIALMAPAMAVNINPQAAASVAGRAVPTSFVLATVGAVTVAHSFGRLTRRLRSTGSAYGVVGSVMGVRAGVAAGWLQVMAYGAFGVTTALTGARFAIGELRALGLPWDASRWALIVGGVVCLGLALGVALASIGRAARMLLWAEVLTVVCIVMVMVVVAWRLATHSAPGGAHFDLRVFVPEHGVGTSALFLGVVFGFLSFAGFEAASTVAEEAAAPERDVPWAMFGTVVVGGAFFVVVTALEMMAFGPRDTVTRFVASEAVVGDLARSYVAPSIAHVVVIGCFVSSLSCCAASLVGAARIVHALAADRCGPRRGASLSARRGIPVTATYAVASSVLVVSAVGGCLTGGDGFVVLVQSGTAGTLLLLVVYALVVLCGLRAPERGVRSMVVPCIGLVMLGYTVFRNLWPWPSGNNRWGPIAVLMALVVVGVTTRLWRVSGGDGEPDGVGGVANH